MNAAFSRPFWSKKGKIVSRETLMQRLWETDSLRG